MPKNLNVRFEDDDLHQRVTDAAGEDRRSVNSEVLHLLDWGLEIRDLRARLANDQAILLERKVQAYEARDTYREAHLDGQIAGIQVALAYLWTPPVFARTAAPRADTEEPQR